MLSKVLSFTQNDKFLAGVDNKNRIKFWNQSSFTSYQSLNKLNGSVGSLNFLQNDVLAIGKCSSNKIEIWNISRKSFVSALNDHKDCVNTLLSVNHSDKTFLLSGSTDTTIRLYDNNFRSIQTLK